MCILYELKVIMNSFEIPTQLFQFLWMRCYTLVIVYMSICVNHLKYSIKMCKVIGNYFSWIYNYIRKKGEFLIMYKRPLYELQIFYYSYLHFTHTLKINLFLNESGKVWGWNLLNWRYLITYCSAYSWFDYIY